MKTTTQVRKWGNSLAIRIPSRLAAELGLANESQIEIVSDGMKATIKRDYGHASSLDELVSRITPSNVHQEKDWGGPVGNEIW
jgi:antitoxin MazE